MSDAKKIAANIQTLLDKWFKDSGQEAPAPARDPEGNTTAHVLWMLDCVVRGITPEGLMNVSKSQRWVGDCMGWLRAKGYLSLTDCRYAALFS